MALPKQLNASKADHTAAFFVTPCGTCGKRVRHMASAAICGHCGATLAPSMHIRCPHPQCNATFRCAELLPSRKASKPGCPRCNRLLAHGIPLAHQPGNFSLLLTQAISWLPSGRRRIDVLAEIERQHLSDRELWVIESLQLEAKRQSTLLAAAQEEANLREAIRQGAGQGALKYVLARHQRLWTENSGWVDTVVREQSLKLESGLHTPSQRLRLFSDAIPGVIAALANAEQVEIRPGLTAEGLARTAPDNQRLYAGEWFVAQFLTAFKRYGEWKAQHPVRWWEGPERLDISRRGVAFERYLAAELRRAGCERVETTKASGDFGADLVANHKGRRIIIQSKSYDGSVGLEAVQQVHAAREPYKAGEAWVVTDSEFTPAARSLAHRTQVGLIDRRGLDTFGESILSGHPVTVLGLVDPEPPGPPAAVPTMAPSFAALSGPPAPPPLLSVASEGVKTSGHRRFGLRYVIAATLAVLVVGVGLAWLAQSASRNAQGEVMAVVDKWVSTTRSLDLQGLMALYAPKIERFYQRRNVGLEEVARNKGDAFRRYSVVQKYELRNLRVEHIDRQEARLVFDKDWDFRDRKTSKKYSGSGRQRLTLRRIGESWLVVGEEELGINSAQVQ